MTVQLTCGHLLVFSLNSTWDILSSQVKMKLNSQLVSWNTKEYLLEDFQWQLNEQNTTLILNTNLYSNQQKKAKYATLQQGPLLKLQDLIINYSQTFQINALLGNQTKD